MKSKRETSHQTFIIKYEYRRQRWETHLFRDIYNYSKVNHRHYLLINYNLPTIICNIKVWINLCDVSVWMNRNQRKTRTVDRHTFTVRMTDKWTRNEYKKKWRERMKKKASLSWSALNACPMWEQETFSHYSIFVISLASSSTGFRFSLLKNSQFVLQHREHPLFFHFIFFFCRI